MIKVLAYLNILRFWPHLLCCLLSKNRGKMAEDLKAYKKHYGIEGGKVYSLDKRYEAVQPAKGLLVDGTEYDTFKSGLKK